MSVRRDAKQSEIKNNKEVEIFTQLTFFDYHIFSREFKSEEIVFTSAYAQVSVYSSLAYL